MLTLRIQLAHQFDFGVVNFWPSPNKPGNALAQFEAELQRIVREEVEAAILALAGQAAREEVQRGE